MQNLIKVWGMFVIAFLAVFIVAASVKTNTSKSIKVAFTDLQPEARKQVNCLADNIYFEARSEPLAGQQAVALVTMNRVGSGVFPSTVCAVVKQKTDTVCQFSWWCEAKPKAQSIARQFDQELYGPIRLVALDTYLNHDKIHDITKGSLFYHADYVSPGWHNLKVTVKIGQHIFYKTKGNII